MAAGPGQTWEARRPPVRAFVLATLAWIADGWLNAQLWRWGWSAAWADTLWWIWLPMAILAVSVWCWLAVLAAVQAVRVAFWSRTWPGRLAPLATIAALVLALAMLGWRR